MTKFITIEDLRNGPKRLRIKAIKQEVVDGAPRLVMYFDDENKKLLLTREIARDLTEAYGPNKMVEDFFALN